MLASPAIESPEMAATARGRKRPSSIVRAASATNSPLLVIELKKSGPPRSCRGVETRTATAISTGTPASTTRPARLRRRRKISRSSERKNRVEGRRRRTAATVSAADIEALPGQGDEDLLQRGAAHPESRDGHALVDARGDQLLRRDPPDHADGGPGRDADVGQAELAHDAGRLP